MLSNNSQEVCPRQEIGHKITIINMIMIETVSIMIILLESRSTRLTAGNYSLYPYRAHLGFSCEKSFKL